MRRSRSAVVLLAILLLAASMRLLFLDADPPLGLRDSGPYHDEGQYTHNARNMALFGVWETDEYNNMFISPILNGLTYISFRLLGVGHWQARLVIALFSLGTLICLYVGIRKLGSVRLALLAVALLGIDCYFLIYSRVALMDVPTVFWMTLAFCGWQYAITGRTWGAIVAGSAAAMAWVFKSLALPFLAVPFLALGLFFLFQPQKRSDMRRNLRLALWMVAGMAVVLLAWWFIFYLPNQPEVAFYISTFASERTPANWGNLWDALRRNLFYLEPAQRTPFLFVLGAIGALALLAQRPWNRSAAGWSFLGVWLAMYAGILLLSPYSPGRYWMTIMPPLAAFSAYGLRALIYPEQHELFVGSGRLSKLSCFLVLTLPAAALFIVSQSFLYWNTELYRRAIRYPLYALAAANVLLANPMTPGFAKLRAAWLAFVRKNRLAVAGIISCLLLVWNLGCYGGLLQQRRYTLTTSAKWLETLLPAGSVILGAGATTVTMQTDFVTIPTWTPVNNWVNGVEPWAAYQADYWIEALYFDDGELFIPPAPGAELLATFEAQGRVMAVWRLPRSK